MKRIILKSRNDQEMENVPERLYSSLKYEVIQSFEGVSKVPILLSKIQIIDPETEREILNQEGNSILIGTSEGVLSADNTGKHQLKGKIHFRDFPHQKRDYSIRVCYYLPSDLMKPVLVLQSPEFKIYTRRSGSASSPLKKRNRDEIDSTKNLSDDVSSNKKKKIELAQYMKQLEELLQLKNKIPKDEQKEAMDLAVSKFKPEPKKMDENLCQNYESMKFEDLFAQTATPVGFSDFGDFDFNQEIEHCIF